MLIESVRRYVIEVFEDYIEVYDVNQEGMMTGKVDEICDTPKAAIDFLKDEFRKMTLGGLIK